LVFALETGRTHQIRVHISEKGNPIIGDVTYGSEARIKSVNGLSLRKMISELGRFALHAAELGFVHPSSGEPMRFSTPWPSEMHSILDHCGFSHDPPTASTEVVV
jgi:23S rRNA pseudouridine1911/1915/1917 synthase